VATGISQPLFLQLHQTEPIGVNKAGAVHIHQLLLQHNPHIRISNTRSPTQVQSINFNMLFLWQCFLGSMIICGLQTLMTVQYIKSTHEKLEFQFITWLFFSVLQCFQIFFLCQLALTFWVNFLAWMIVPCMMIGVAGFFGIGPVVWAILEVDISGRFDCYIMIIVLLWTCFCIDLAALLGHIRGMDCRFYGASRGTQVAHTQHEMLVPHIRNPPEQEEGIELDHIRGSVRVVEYHTEHEQHSAGIDPSTQTPREHGTSVGSGPSTRRPRQSRQPTPGMGPSTWRPAQHRQSSRRAGRGVQRGSDLYAKQHVEQADTTDGAK